MVTTKDVSMEPTIKSLNDDLVCGQIKHLSSKNCKTVASFIFSCDDLLLLFIYIIVNEIFLDFELIFEGKMVILWHFIYT